MATKIQKKIVKKRWIQIISPKLFNSAPIGEILLEDSSNAVGRKFSANLASLTGDGQRQYTNVNFKAVSKEGDNILTEITGFEMSPVATRRLVRKGKDSLNMSFETVSADGIRIRVKPFAVTKTKVKGGTFTAVRKHLQQQLISMIAKNSFEEFLMGIFSNRVQKSLSDSVKKIYPLSRIEIRVVKVTGIGTPPKIIEKQVVVEPSVVNEESAQDSEEIIDQVAEAEAEKKASEEKLSEIEENIPESVQAI